MKYSKEYLNQQSLRRDRLQRQAQLSERKTKAQNLAKQGISTDDSQPYERERVLEDDLEDEALQIKQAQKNIAQLFKDKEEAAILLNRLRESDLIPKFNAKFPRIFRELKSNYGDVTAYDAYYIIIDVLASNNEPLTNKSFAQILNAYVTQLKNEMKNINNKSEAQRLQDDLMKLDAVKKTYKQLNDSGKEILESLSEDRNRILDFVEEGELNRLFDEEGDIDEDIKDSGDVFIEDDSDYDEEEKKDYNDVYVEDDSDEEENNKVLQEWTAADIDKMFKNNDTASLEGVANVLKMKLTGLKGTYTKKNNNLKSTIALNNVTIPSKQLKVPPSGAEYIAIRLNSLMDEAKEND
jgi:hypothetical protein